MEIQERKDDTWTQNDEAPRIFEFTGEPGVKIKPNFNKSGPQSLSNGTRETKVKAKDAPSNEAAVASKAKEDPKLSENGVKLSPLENGKDKSVQEVNGEAKKTDVQNGKCSSETNGKKHETRQHSSDVDTSIDTDSTESDEEIGLDDADVYENALKGKAVPCLKLFLTDQVIQFLITETNKTAERKLIEIKLPRKVRRHIWKPVTDREMWTFLALVFATGYKRIFEVLLQEEFVTACEFFEEHMEQKRFEMILAFLTLGSEDTPKSIKKIQPVLDMICSQFSSVYKPEKELSLFEEDIPWFSIVPKINPRPEEPRKVKLKVYTLCESESGYTCGIIPCFEKQKSVNEAIPELMKENLRQGYHVYLSKCNFDFSLVKKLYEQKTHICAKIRLPKEVPAALTKARKEAKENKVSYLRNDETLIMFCQQIGGSKPTTFLSTMHDAQCIDHVIKRHRKTVPIPKLLLDYKKKMNRLCDNDFITEFLPLGSDRLPWPKRLFITLMQHVMINAYTVFKKCTSEEVKFRQFYRAAVKDLIEEYSEGEAGGNKEEREDDDEASDEELYSSEEE